MLKFYKTDNSTINKLEFPTNGCWVSMIKPTASELDRVSEHYNIDVEIFEVVLDMNERSRIDIGDNYRMIVMNIPSLSEDSEKETFITVPISILLVEGAVITICGANSPILDDFESSKVIGLDTTNPSKFILQLLGEINILYIKYLDNIDALSEKVESKLMQSTQNEELFELLKLQKSLVYFTTSLSSNKVVLEKLLRTEFLKGYEVDSELLEDALVENSQALEMANIYTQILSGTVDTFASIISNNLNIVMKILAVVTIVLSVPTMIFSAYGMNLHIAGVPFGQHPWGFPIVTGLSLIICVIVTWIFVKLKLF